MEIGEVADTYCSVVVRIVVNYERVHPEYILDCVQCEVAIRAPRHWHDAVEPFFAHPYRILMHDILQELKTGRPVYCIFLLMNPATHTNAPIVEHHAIRVIGWV
jgi:hypothetical protein